MNETSFHQRSEYEPDPPDRPATPQPLPPATPPPARSEWGQVLQSSPNTLASNGSTRMVIREVLETLIYILLVFIIVRSMVQNFKIEGSSMEPSLHSEQYILVNKLVYFHFDLHAPLRLLPGNEDLPPDIIYPLHTPQRGDVVVFEYPLNVRKDFIKRVIGLPGDTVTFRDGQVLVNDMLLDEPYLQGAPTFCSSASRCNREPIVVPDGHIFVMGDNRANSSDSREWDPLPLHRVIGQAWVLYWPMDDWGVLQPPPYAQDTFAPPVQP